MLLRFILQAFLFVVGLAVGAATDRGRPMAIYQDKCRMQESKKKPGLTGENLPFPCQSSSTFSTPKSPTSSISTTASIDSAALL